MKLRKENKAAIGLQKIVEEVNAKFRRRLKKKILEEVFSGTMRVM